MEPPMKEGTWLALFGPVVADDCAMQGALGYAVQVRRGCGRALEEGKWRRRVEMVTPVAGWQGKYDGTDLTSITRVAMIQHVNA